MTYATPYLFSFLLLVASICRGQNLADLPALERLNHSVDSFFVVQTNIQIAEVTQTKRYRFLNYMPSPGYSPFAGGFTIQLNLTAPLQEIRLNHAEKVKREFIASTNLLAAKELKNGIWVDYQRVVASIDEYQSQVVQDSLTVVLFQLSQRKYSKNELTPTEFLTLSKTFEAYFLNRKKERNAITQSINNLTIKSKMDAPSGSVH